MIRAFFRDSAIYTIPSILSYGMSFFLIPLYTRVLSPSDYGALDLIIAFGLLITYLVGLEVNQGVARLYLDEKTDAGKRSLSSSALLFTIFAFTFFSIIAFAFTPELSGIVLGTSDLDNVFRLGIVFIWINGIFNLLKIQLRFELRSEAYAIVSVVHALTTAGISVLLAYVFQYGLYGLFAGMIIGIMTGSILALWYLRTTYQFHFDLSKLKTILSFSIPLVPSSISVFVSMYIGRLMINYYLSLTEVGLYGIAYRIANVSTLLLIGFQMAMAPLIYAHYLKQETPAHLEKIFRIFLCMILIVFLVLSLYANIALMILTTPAYYAAGQVVVFLVPAVLLSQMYIFAPGIGIARKTHLFIGINVAGAILNILLNWTLIPRIGYVGAGIATLIGYFCVFCAIMYYSQKFYYVPHNWKIIGASVFFTAGIVIIGLNLHFDFYTDIFVKGGLILLMPVAYLLCGLIQKSEILYGITTVSKICASRNFLKRV